MQREFGKAIEFGIGRIREMEAIHDTGWTWSIQEGELTADDAGLSFDAGRMKRPCIESPSRSDDSQPRYCHAR
jgi:hypothetical protein